MTRLLQYEPWLVAAFGRQLDELTAALPYLSWITPARPGRWAPACEVFSRDGDLVVALDLPGIDPDKDVQVTVQDATLCISGERHRPGGADARTDGYRRPEGRYGKFERAFALPQRLTGEGITASYHDGVLEVTVPKAAQPAARHIPVGVTARPKVTTALAGSQRPE